MPLGPVFSVELITASRRTRYFVLRAIYAAVLLVAFWIVYAGTVRFRNPSNDLRVMAELTAAFFTGFSFVQMFVVLLIGPAMMAGAIASERERRTIEYLFAADLGDAEIVLNKLAARIVQIAMLLLTGLPILSIAMLLGGIAPEALLVVYAITGSTVVTVAALGIAVSVWSQRVREAVTKVYLTLLALLLVPVLLWSASQSSAAMPRLLNNVVFPANDQLVAANPLFILGDALTEASGEKPEAAWEKVITLVRNQFILSGLLVAAAVFGVRRVHLKQSGGEGKKKKLAWRFQLWRPGIGERPMIWKELFAQSSGIRLGLLGTIVGGLLVASVLITAGWIFFSAVTQPRQGFMDDWPQGMLIMLADAVACGMLILIAARSAGSITSEKERDTWDSLLTTTLGGGEIASAKVLGSLWAVRWWLAVWAVVWTMAVLLNEMLLFGAIGTLVVLLMLAFYASSLGTLCSVHAKSSLRAMGTTLGVAVFFGGGYLFCCIPVFMSSHGGEEISFAGVIPFLLAFPGIVCFDSHTPGEVVGAFVLGLIGYGIASVVLYGLAVDRLETRIGRTPVGVGPARGPLPTNLPAGLLPTRPPLDRPLDVQPLPPPARPGSNA